MLRSYRELLADLARVNTQVPQFVLEFMDGALSIEAEEAFAHRLVDVAEQLMNHAKARRRLVIDGWAMAIEPRRELGYEA